MLFLTGTDVTSAFEDPRRATGASRQFSSFLHSSADAESNRLLVQKQRVGMRAE